MLATAARMRRRREFDLAIRRGRRAAGSLLSAHLFCAGCDAAAARSAVRGRDTLDGASSAGPGRGGIGDGEPPVLVGFIVSRAVGGAVVRNRVKRRLREVARARTACLPPGSLLVIRADPRAADVRQRDLAAELDLVLGRLLRRQVRA